MFASLLFDWSRSFLDHVAVGDSALLKLPEVAGPQTPDNEDFNGGQRALLQAEALPEAASAYGQPVDFSALFKQPAGAIVVHSLACSKI